MARAAKKRSSAKKRTSIKDLPAKNVAAGKARSVKGGAATLLNRPLASAYDVKGAAAPRAADGSV